MIQTTTAYTHYRASLLLSSHAAMTGHAMLHLELLDLFAAGCFKGASASSSSSESSTSSSFAAVLERAGLIFLLELAPVAVSEPRVRPRARFLALMMSLMVNGSLPERAGREYQYMHACEQTIVRQGINPLTSPR